MMYCEICEINLADPGDARRHIISVAHMRQRRNLDLSRDKIVKRINRISNTSKNLVEVHNLICQSGEAIDFKQMREAGFFKIEHDGKSVLIKELIDTLYQTATDFYINNLPNELREKLLESYETHFKKKFGM